jgi:hypothetical protein
VDLSLAILLVLGMFVVNAPKNAEAASGVSHLEVAEGVWSTGTEVAVDLTITSAPTWMQLLTSGVKISTNGLHDDILQVINKPCSESS